MQPTIALQQLRIAPAWRPPAWSPPRPALSQQVPLTAVPASVPAPAPAPVSNAMAKPAFIDSALVATIQDFIGAGVTGFLAWGASGAWSDKPVLPSRWTWVYLAIASGLLFKGFVDLSRIRER